LIPAGFFVSGVACGGWLGNAAAVDVGDIGREDFRNLLAEIAGARMPFGKFGIQAYPPAGVPLMDLPLEYLAWFKQRGFPKGRLGELMAVIYEIKEVGCDRIFDPLRAVNGGRFQLRPAPRKRFEFE
jgi:uncharacterized protein (DUF3820 family)